MKASYWKPSLRMIEVAVRVCHLKPRRRQPTYVVVRYGRRDGDGGAGRGRRRGRRDRHVDAGNGHAGSVILSGRNDTAAGGPGGRGLAMLMREALISTRWTI